VNIIREIKKQREWSLREHLKGNKISLIPTMGFLHKGHLSLIKKAREYGDKIVVSIFVNPTQFSPSEDFDKYPRDEKRDLRLLRKEGIDIVFIPKIKDIYPDEYESYVIVKELSKIYCGKSRPKHFCGVTTIVLKLFNIVNPDFGIFGEKDYQQYIIIKKMCRDLNIQVKIIPSPIVREKDGLAMSSRNRYLLAVERKEATVLYKSLKLAEDMANKGVKDVKTIKKEMTKLIKSKKFPRIDYIEFVEPESLRRVKTIEGPVRILEAIWIGKARLIDNIEIKPKFNN
jgi:pantoate--beta-alanine ligase